MPISPMSSPNNMNKALFWYFIPSKGVQSDQSKSAVFRVKLLWLFYPLLNKIFNRPPLSCAAAKNQINASHSPVLHFQASSCSLVQDSTVLKWKDMEKIFKKLKTGVACKASQDHALPRSAAVSLCIAGKRTALSWVVMQFKQ